MSSIEDFYRNECELIPAAKVNAYVTPLLNPLNQSELVIDSSWGEEKVDLAPVVKLNETVTHMKLSPEDTPLYLEFDNEAGERDCIYGDELAQIIPIMKLKDVDDTNEPEDGDTLVFDDATSKFKTYPLVPTIEDLDERVTANRTDINALQTTVENLRQTVIALTNRVLVLEEILRKPQGIPTDAKVVWGTINLYSDSTNSNLKTDGFYTHNPTTDKTNDERFA